MVGDAQRRMLYAALEHTLGPEPAEVMMDFLPPVSWSDVARSDTVDALGVSLRGEMAELRGEMAELRGEMAELRGEMAELRAEIKQGLARLEAKIDAQFPKLIAANVVAVFTSAVSTAGLVLAAARMA